VDSSLACFSATKENQFDDLEMSWKYITKLKQLIQIKIDLLYDFQWKNKNRYVTDQNAWSFHPLVSRVIIQKGVTRWTKCGWIVLVKKG
jgi:hypothetical protein